MRAARGAARISCGGRSASAGLGLLVGGWLKRAASRRPRVLRLPDGRGRQWRACGSKIEGLSVAGGCRRLPAVAGGCRRLPAVAGGCRRRRAAAVRRERATGRCKPLESR
jgi:hypothetical protein